MGKISGTINKELLENLFREFNSAYFSGELKRCKCSVLYGNHELGVYTHRKNSKGAIDGRIWIAKNVNWTIRSLTTVFVHEMVHHWVWQTYGGGSGIMGHGWRFMKKCRELNKIHGLNLKRVNPEIYRKNEKIPTTRFGRLLRYVKKSLYL